MKSRLLGAMCACYTCIASGVAFAANITPYYLTDGDNQIVYEIKNGEKTNSFSTFRRGNPIAVRDTIWLGDLDDAEAREYTLSGTATGSSSSGGRNFTQLLDGAAGPDGNYSAQCCGSENFVTVANSDWSDQRSLFSLGSTASNGIAYDLSDNTLYVADSTRILHYDLLGNIINNFSFGQSLAALAYEQITDTFWGFNRGTNNIVQFDRDGNVSQDVDIPGFNPGNVWGGEMIVNAVPIPAAFWLFGSGLLGLIGISRRKKA